MEMPQRPYIFNVYLLISTAAYNALFLIPASRIPFQSCHLHAASISTLPITPFSLSLSPPFSRKYHYSGVDCYASTIEPPMTLPVHLHSLPCIPLQPFFLFSSMWKTQLFFRMGHTQARFTNHELLSVPSGLCSPECIRTHACYACCCRTQYIVMSFPSAPLAVTGCLFFLR